MLFKSAPLKAIIHGRKTIKFCKNGLYETTDKDEIKTIGGAVGVEKVEKTISN